MKSRHITEILDRAAFADLSEADKTTISAHAADCASCRRAFEAARLSAVLLKAGNSIDAPLAPPPFFQAKVMNAWRERKQPITSRPMEAFRRWWQASAAPVFAMLATMAVLVTLTFLAPKAGADDSAAEISEFNLYSTDAVLLNQKPPRDLTTDQVFEVIYNPKK